MTTGTFLRSATRINECDNTTGAFSLVRGVLHELSPSYIGNASVDYFAPAGLHVGDVQLFEGDKLVTIYQLTRFLMREIVATIGGTLIRVPQRMDNFFSLWAALRKLFLLALKAGNIGGVLLHPSLAFYFLSIAKISKGSQAQVNTDDFGGGRECNRLDRAGEAGVEVANSVTLDCERLDCTDNGPMQLDSDRAYFRQDKPVTVKFESDLRIGKRVVPSLPLEARIAGSFTSLDTAKESLECQVNSYLDIL